MGLPTFVYRESFAIYLPFFCFYFSYRRIPRQNGFGLLHSATTDLHPPNINRVNRKPYHIFDIRPHEANVIFRLKTPKEIITDYYCQNKMFILYIYICVNFKTTLYPSNIMLCQCTRKYDILYDYNKISI